MVWRTVTTGSVMISEVIGQRYSSGTSTSARAPEGPAPLLLPAPPSAIARSTCIASTSSS